MAQKAFTVRNKAGKVIRSTDFYPEALVAMRADDPDASITCNFPNDANVVAAMRQDAAPPGAYMTLKSVGSGAMATSTFRELERLQGALVAGGHLLLSISAEGILAEGQDNKWEVYAKCSQCGEAITLAVTEHNSSTISMAVTKGGHLQSNPCPAGYKPPLLLSKNRLNF